MAKRRRQKPSGGSKLKTSPKGKAKNKPVLEKDRDKETSVELSLETAPSSPKKQKLEKGETAEPPAEKYIPRFTALPRVAKLRGGRLGLKKTEEKCLQFDHYEFKDDKKLNNTTEISPSQEKEYSIDSLTNIKEITESIITAVCLTVDQGNIESKVEKNKPMKDSSSEDIENTLVCVTTDELVPLIETDRDQINDRGLNDDNEIAVDKMNEDPKPNTTGNTVLSEEKVMFRVPKLSCIVKKYVDKQENEKIIAEAEDLEVNSSSSIDDEEEEHKGSTGSQRICVDNVCPTSTTIELNSQGCPQVQISKESNGSILAGNDDDSNENGQFVNKRDLFDNFGKTLTNDESEKQSGISADHDEPRKVENDDQEVPVEVVNDVPTPEIVFEEGQYKALILNQEDTFPSVLAESNVNDQAQNNPAVVAIVSNDILDRQSFAKEFEALEELLPEDDMGLFDDVIDDNLKTSSVKIEIPEGDRTIEFLSNELSTLNCMVINYQRAVQEMAKHFKISGRY